MRNLQAVYYTSNDKALIHWEGKRVITINNVSKNFSVKGLSKEGIEELVLLEHRDLAEEVINDFSFEFEQ